MDKEQQRLSLEGCGAAGASERKVSQRLRVKWSVWQMSKPSRSLSMSWPCFSYNPSRMHIEYHDARGSRSSKLAFFGRLNRLNRSWPAIPGDHDPTWQSCRWDSSSLAISCASSWVLQRLYRPRCKGVAAKSPWQVVKKPQMRSQ